MRVVVGEVGVAHKHLQADLGNQQCCWLPDKIRQNLQARQLHIWCCDPRGGTPRYCVLGGSWAVLFRLIGAYVHLLPDTLASHACAVLHSAFRDICNYYRTLVRPCTHGAEDGFGCGYLGELQRYPEKYNLHPSVGSLVRLLDGCRSGYDGYEIVRGDRDKALGAIVLWSDGVIPMVTPKQGSRMFFVWHPQIEEMLLDWVADIMLAHFHALVGHEVEQHHFRKYLWEMTNRHVALALEKLAPGKPVFELWVRSGVLT